MVASLQILPGWTGFPNDSYLKGKLGEKNLLAQSLYRTLREVSIGNFNRKAPKLVKNQVEWSKNDQIRTKWPKATVGIRSILAKSYCRNPSIQAKSYCRNPSIQTKWIPTVAVGLNWRIPTVAFGLN